ncbi:T-complex 11 [Zopfochytrium polystomum]|nr:T-complex 11 [Zopfochytrium polystomum]
MSNEQLAHELTLDPDFALKKPELSALETQVRDSVRKIFFDDVRSSFARGEYLPHLIDFITDIRKQLLSMVSEKGKIAADLVEFMDVEFIHQKIVTKTLDLKGLLSFVITKMSQLCAPIRDQAVRDLNASLNAVAGSADFVGVIEGILGLLDDMKLDLANFRLQSLKPHLKDVAVEYERGHFKTALESGSVTLDRTKEWLSRSVRLQEEVARARNPEGIAIPENRVRYTDAFHDAILGLVFGWNGSAVVKDSAAGEASTSAPDTDGALPETLVMDAVRLNKFQNEAQKLVIIAALIMLSQNIVTEIRGDKAFVIGLKENLLALLNDPEGLTLDNLSLQVVAKISEILLQRRNKQLGEDKVALIKTMVEKTMSTKDPVFNLVRRRVMAAIKAHIVTGTFKREGLDRAGLEPVRTELESFSYKVSVWVRFNGEVYTEYYDSILKELI